MLGAMFSGRHEVQTDEDGVVFIDRDGTHFRHILNFLRNPEHFAFDILRTEQFEMKREAIYYGLICEMFPPILLKDSFYNSLKFMHFRIRLNYGASRRKVTLFVHIVHLGRDDDYLVTFFRSCGCAFVFIKSAINYGGAVKNVLDNIVCLLHNQSQPIQLQPKFVQIAKQKVNNEKFHVMSLEMSCFR